MWGLPWDPRPAPRGCKSPENTQELLGLLGPPPAPVTPVQTHPGGTRPPARLLPVPDLCPPPGPRSAPAAGASERLLFSRARGERGLCAAALAAGKWGRCEAGGGGRNAAGGSAAPRGAAGAVGVPGGGWGVGDTQGASCPPGIVTKGSEMYDYYVTSYRVSSSRDGKNWRPYRSSGGQEDKVFEGNVDGHGEVSNAFIPPIVTRYLRVTPRSWHQRVAMKVALLGCQLARARAPQPYAPGGPEEIPLPVPTGRTPVPGVALDPEKAGSTLLVMLLVGGFVLLCSSLLLLAFLCRRRRKPAAELNCGLAKGYPKLESSPGCSLGSLPPPGSTPPSFPVAAPLGDLSQPPSPGNGDAGVWMGPTAWRGGRTNLCTPTLHPGEPSQPPPTLVQPPSCILNPLQREKSLRLIHGWYWRAPGSPRAVLSPWGGCPALPGEVLTAPGGRAGALSPPVTTHLSPPPHGAGGGSGL
uniref:F5/8 type C domain-containing protein n=1 Tax=Anser cygnoides TaxID=8845 RepID=A0A8B9D6Y6_ANSCY